MPTRTLTVDAERPEELAIHEAVTVLRRGGLVALPTETVYGLAADAQSADAVRRIFEAKGRPDYNPVIVHATDAATARKAVSAWPPAAEKLAAAFWPGPLTLVLPRASWVPDVVTAGAQTVGVRVPRHAVAHEVLRAGNLWLAAPSANRSQKLSPTRAEHVLADLDDRIDLVLDAGPTPGGIESTVVALMPNPRILRPGPITQEMLEVVLGQECPIWQPCSKFQQSLPSPGMLERHYAPRTPLECSTRPVERFAELLAEGRRVGWLTLPTDNVKSPTVASILVAMPGDPTDYGRRLYSELHWLDGQGLDCILVSLPPETLPWAAIRDRLRRASAL